MVYYKKCINEEIYKKDRYFLLTKHCSQGLSIKKSITKIAANLKELAEGLEDQLITD